MTRDEAVREIRSSDFARYAVELEAALLPAVRLETRRSEDLPLLASRIGGLPALPPEVAWPMWNATGYFQSHIDHIRSRAKSPGGIVDRLIARYQSAMAKPELALSFLAQINLGDLAGLRTNLPLPNRGLMLFFYEMSQQPWGFDPKGAGAFRILYCAETEGLQLREPPEACVRTFPQCGVAVSEVVTLPARLTAGDGFDLHDVDTYFDLMTTVNRGEGHQIGGHPEEVQGDMTLDCQLVANGIYCGDSDYLKDPRVAGLRAGAADWRLLLQLESDSNVDWGWGDSGLVYFWIREKDLVARNFERPWMVLQCG